MQEEKDYKKQIEDLELQLKGFKHRAVTILVKCISEHDYKYAPIYQAQKLIRSFEENL